MGKCPGRPGKLEIPLGNPGGNSGPSGLGVKSLAAMGRATGNNPAFLDDFDIG